MLKKFVIRMIGTVLCFGFVFLCLNVNFQTIFSIKEDMVLTISALQELNDRNVFGECVEVGLVEDICTTSGQKQKRTSVVVKLFGFIPIKKNIVVMCDERDVYLGGMPLGFSVNTKGVIIVGKNSVYNGNTNVVNEILNVGDILTHINGNYIKNQTDINSIVASTKTDNVEYTFIRDNKIHKEKGKLLFDKELNCYKLGVWIRNKAQGVGTLTFVTKEGDFGALGHPITDFETGVDIDVDNGVVYNATTIGITKGQNGKAGQLRCLFVEGENNKGSVTKNSDCGVFGNLNKADDTIDKNLEVGVSPSILVNVGKAKIVCDVSGVSEEYDIEIIKINSNKTKNNKCFVFRVTDKRLIKLTGGVVQGMSGSPIVQNGKLIGAVTHVFLFDATKGYGVFSDFMLDEIA